MLIFSNSLVPIAKSAKSEVTSAYPKSSPDNLTSEPCVSFELQCQQLHSYLGDIKPPMQQLNENSVAQLVLAVVISK